MPPIPFRMNPGANSGWPQGNGWHFYTSIGKHNASIVAGIIGAPIDDIKNTIIDYEFTLNNFSGGFDSIFGNVELLTSSSQASLQYGLCEQFNPRRTYVSNGQAKGSLVADPNNGLGTGRYKITFSADSVIIKTTNNQIIYNIKFTNPPAYNTTSFGILLRAYATVYSCKLYKHGILIHDYIPCKNPENKLGVWDKIGRKFYKVSNDSYAYTLGTEFFPKL